MGNALSRHTETFIVRLWSEYLAQTPPTWRGEIQHVGSREVMRFANLHEMEDWIQGQIQSSGGEHEEQQR